MDLALWRPLSLFRGIGEAAGACGGCGGGRPSVPMLGAWKRDGFPGQGDSARRTKWPVGQGMAARAGGELKASQGALGLFLSTQGMVGRRRSHFKRKVLCGGCAAFKRRRGAEGRQGGKLLVPARPCVHLGTIAACLAHQVRDRDASGVERGAAPDVSDDGQHTAHQGHTGRLCRPLLCAILLGALPQRILPLFHVSPFLLSPPSVLFLLPRHSTWPPPHSTIPPSLHPSCAVTILHY